MPNKVVDRVQPLLDQRGSERFSLVRPPGPASSTSGTIAPTAALPPHLAEDPTAIDDAALLRSRLLVPALRSTPASPSGDAQAHYGLYAN